MHLRRLPRIDVHVSEIGVGCWQIGGAEWGNVDHEVALNILSTAHENGVTMFDTADIYGDGRSERVLGEFLRGVTQDPERPVLVATKLGRNAEPGWPKNFTLDVMRRHAEGSRERLGVEQLDLLQLHCVPAAELRRGEVFDHLRTLRDEGLIRAFGASVETDEEARLCLAQEDLATLQIIFNVFRQTPIDAFFATAEANGVALIVRLPLASGLLSGRYTLETTFEPTDHRSFNRDGQAFHVGETFAGLPYDKGLELVEEIRPLAPPETTLAQFAQRWILDHEAVTTVITGASRPDQARRNAAVSDLPPLPQDTHDRLSELFANRVRPLIRGPV